MTSLQSRVVAYSLIWIVLRLYFFRMNRQIARLHSEVERLEERVRSEGDRG